MCGPFVADAIVVRDPDQARRLIRDATNPGNARSRPRLRRTQTPFRYLSADDGAEISTFMTQLIAMRRPAFDRAMRAIRRVVDAAILADSDATSRTAVRGCTGVAGGGRRKPRLRPGTITTPRSASSSTGNSPGFPTPTRNAFRRLFSRPMHCSYGESSRPSCCNTSTRASYRDEAVGATRPIRSVDLPNALNFAYQARSKSLHEMRALAPELWLLAGSDDTARVDDLNVLALEGLNRLCRHVICNYVRRARPGVDESFDWRSALPGVVRVPLSPACGSPGIRLVRCRRRLTVVQRGQCSCSRNRGRDEVDCRRHAHSAAANRGRARGRIEDRTPTPADCDVHALASSRRPRLEAAKP